MEAQEKSKETIDIEAEFLQKTSEALRDVSKYFSERMNKVRYEFIARGMCKEDVEEFMNTALNVIAKRNLNPGK